MEVAKWIIVMCILIVYCGVILGLMVEFATTDNPHNRMWSGLSIIPAILMPSALTAIMTRRK